MNLPNGYHTENKGLKVTVKLTEIDIVKSIIRMLNRRNKMRKLSTIQKREKLNDVYAVDGKGPGGANHRYIICEENETCWCDGSNSVGVLADIFLQRGPRKDKNSQHGVIDTDLLEIVRDRMKAFQAGPFASEYNEKALEHIEWALMYLNRRVEDRIERNVLGKNEK